MQYLAGLASAYAAEHANSLSRKAAGFMEGLTKRARAVAAARARSMAAAAGVRVRPRGRAPFRYPAYAPRRVARYRPNTLYARNIRHAGLLGIEHKYYDTSLVGSVLSNNADCSGGEQNPSATSLISTPAQGDAHNNRDGREIVITAIELEGHVTFPRLTGQTQATRPAIVFVALVMDTQTNAAALNSEDVYINPGGDSGMVCEPLRNILYGARFRVLKTWRMQQRLNYFNDSATTATAAGDRLYFQFYRKNMRIKVRFNTGTTASVANVTDNSLQVIAWVNDISYTPVISYNARIRFVG